MSFVVEALEIPSDSAITPGVAREPAFSLTIRRCSARMSVSPSSI